MILIELSLGTTEIDKPLRIWYNFDSSKWKSRISYYWSTGKLISVMKHSFAVIPAVIGEVLVHNKLNWHFVLHFYSFPGYWNREGEYTYNHLLVLYPYIHLSGHSFTLLVIHLSICLAIHSFIYVTQQRRSWSVNYLNLRRRIGEISPHYVICAVIKL